MKLHELFDKTDILSNFFLDLSFVFRIIWWRVMFSMSSSKIIFLNKSLSVIHLFPDRKAVIFSNSAQQTHSTSLFKMQHFSHLHQLLMLVTFDRPLTSISKNELFKYFGWISVPRSSTVGSKLYGWRSIKKYIILDRVTKLCTTINNKKDHINISHLHTSY